MRILRIVFWGCFLPFLGIGLAQGTQGAVKEQTGAPVIVVEESTYDFGQVSQGKVLTREFRVLNQGTAPLEIKKVKPG